jgi:polyisoprenoid-binding protein YceI
MRFAFLLLPLTFVLAACGTPEIDEKPAAQVQDVAPDAAAKPDAAAAPKVAAGAETQLAINPEASAIGFIGAKVTRSHKGGFKSFTGSGVTREGVPVSTEFSIDMNSIWSDTEKLTGHLKSADFFEVETYPKATFSSTEISEGGEGGSHTVKGVLDMHGVKKEVTFVATIEGGESETKVAAAFKINRKDWGIVYPGAPDDLIKDEVAIELNLSFLPAEG